MKRPMILSAKEAATLIPDGSTLLTTGFSLLGVAEEIYKAIEARFLATDSPCGLTFVHAAGQTDSVGGMEHLAHAGLLRRVVGSHWGLSQRFVQLISSDQIEAFCLPMGQLIASYKASAAGRPGVLSKVGLGTFIDPLQEGGKINPSSAKSVDAFVNRVRIGEEDYLFYQAPHFDFYIGRGTTADEFGNISTEDEAVKLELLSAVQAVKRCGGKVMVQVKHLAKAGSLPPKDVTIPGIFVDAIVLCEQPDLNHRMTSGSFYDPALNSRLRDARAWQPSFSLSPLRRLIGDRAAQEVKPGDTINLGVGIPGDAVGSALQRKGLTDQVTLSVESGTIGGVPLGGGDFGCAKNPIAIIEKPYQFDFYNGIGVDITFMGAAEVDVEGNVNVSKFGERTVGCGGFIDITHSAKKVVFCGTFTAGGLDVELDNGVLKIRREGRTKKFVKRVSQITFSGAEARRRGQQVLFVTERAVFNLTERGVEIIEVAPGLNLKADILDRMEFVPLVHPHIQEMNSEFFIKE